MSESPIISIRGLTKLYHVGDVDVHALRGVDLDVARGEFLSIVGPSGSGKSTLFHIIGGLTPPTAGSISIDGRDLLSMSESDRTNLRKKSVGFVFQKYNLQHEPHAHGPGQHRDCAAHCGTQRRGGTVV